MAIYSGLWRTRVNPVEIVEIRREIKAFNGSLDVLLNMGSRVGDAALAKDIEATLRGDWCWC
jgi:hypothetical protein